MDRTEQFRQHISGGYTFKGDYIVMGTAMLDKAAVPNTQVKVPLKMLNRHGMISGATGTGKTKTLQVLCEQVSAKGIPVLIMDIKGDVSGMAQPGNPHPKIDERMEKIGETWQPTAFPVELLSISEEPGVRLRATVSEFGPVLFSKILDLNDTQQGVVALVFKYCDDNGMPLLDLKDFRKTLHYLTNDGKQELAAEYGTINSASAGTILRKIVEIEEQGADTFFGERSFDVQDLLRTDDRGMGFINVMRLTDLQDRPKLFSTFMLSLLAEVYSTFSEVGDADAPKLIIVIDEAHLIFKEASKALLDQIETIIKLIRSKGVGIYFCTQLPTDVPEAVLSQLGLKVQHALRAFTAKDRKAIKMTAENYPISEYYNTDEVLTQLGIGEALITGLNEKGIPTPLAHTLLVAPRSRMDVLNDQEIRGLITTSRMVSKYNDTVDRESAYEMLEKKLAQAEKAAKAAEASAAKNAPAGRSTTGSGRTSRRRQKSTLEQVTGSRAFNTAIREISRGLLGALIKGIK
jgi:DNA helicase HerA-like ATPase